MRVASALAKCSGHVSRKIEVLYLLHEGQKVEHVSWTVTARQALLTDLKELGRAECAAVATAQKKKGPSVSQGP